MPDKPVLIEITEEEHDALKRLQTLGRALSKGQSWETHLASRWKKDPDTEEDVLVAKIVLNTGDLKALADLQLG